jgi:hypothetical protein
VGIGDMLYSTLDMASRPQTGGSVAGSLAHRQFYRLIMKSEESGEPYNMLHIHITLHMHVLNMLHVRHDGLHIYYMSPFKCHTLHITHPH